MITDSLIGTRIDEYEIEALLGKGGMARVYCGLDIYLQRHVAVKVIDTPYRMDADYARRFEREAQAIAQLEHPHIVRLYRYGEKDGMFYMAMQYVDGADLQTVLTSYRQDGERMEIEDILRIARQVCSALDYTHQCGVIHRDIKPSNIMLNRQGDAVLTDFGLALSIDVGTRGEVLGSPTHIAPEQALSSANAVPQTDLYSFGVILYEMLVGRLPFQSDDALALAMMHVKEPPPPPRRFRPELSPKTEALLLKVLSKQPQDRYATGAELVEALEQALENAAPVSFADRISSRTLLERASSLPSRHPLTPLTIPPAQAQACQLVPPAALPPRQTAVPVWTAATGPLPPQAHPPVQAPSLHPPVLPPQAGPQQRQGKNPAPTVILSRIPRAGWLGLTLALFLCVALSAASLGLNFLLQKSRQAQAASPSVTPAAYGIGQKLPSPTLAVTAAVTATQKSPTPIFADLNPSPTPTTLVYMLMVMTHSDESLVVYNRTGQAFPLVDLRLGDGRQALLGSEWKIQYLKPGECVVAVNSKGKPKLPEVDCRNVGQLDHETFWKNSFPIYYQEQKILTCQSEDEEGGDKVCVLVLGR